MGIAAPGNAQERPRVVHVFVALADNEHQGIVPVPKALGNGDDPARNLYWGPAFGLRTYFRNATEWKEVLHSSNPTSSALERAVFYCVNGNVVLIADAYRGREIGQGINDFFTAAAGSFKETPIQFRTASGKEVEAASKADLAVYVGHDGFWILPWQRHSQTALRASGKR